MLFNGLDLKPFLLVLSPVERLLQIILHIVLVTLDPTLHLELQLALGVPELLFKLNLQYF